MATHVTAFRLACLCQPDRQDGNLVAMGGGGRGAVQGVGLPLIFSDGMRDWEARRKWTLDHLRKCYGGYGAPCAGNRQIPPTARGIDCTKPGPRLAS
jgi:hypothetical protein